MKTLWRNFLIWLGGLLLILSLVKCNAQVKTNSFYFTLEYNGQTNVTYVLAYCSPDVTPLVTHTNLKAFFCVQTVPWTGSNSFDTVTYWFGDTNAMLAPLAAEWMPYIPPPLTPEQQLILSNKVWLRFHPTIIATPKSGALRKSSALKLPMP